MTGIEAKPEVGVISTPLFSLRRISRASCKDSRLGVELIKAKWEPGRLQHCGRNCWSGVCHNYWRKDSKYKPQYPGGPNDKLILNNTQKKVSVTSGKLSFPAPSILTSSRIKIQSLWGLLILFQGEGKQTLTVGVRTTLRALGLLSGELLIAVHGQWVVHSAGHPKSFYHPYWDLLHHHHPLARLSHFMAAGSGETQA